MKILTHISLVLLVFYTKHVTAQPGILDSSFRFNGKANVPTGIANAVAVSGDDKVVVGGSSSAGFTVVRYLKNGLTDKNFGVNGKATVYLDSTLYDNKVSSVSIVADGKIVAAGDDGNNFVVAKFKYNGLLDSSFAVNGLSITGFKDKEAHVNFAIIQPDNKILVVGYGFIIKQDMETILLARYNPDGSPDKSFGNNGKLIVDLHQGGFDFANSAILQPDGKIVVAGTSFKNNMNQFALFRLMPNGNIDSTFGTNGYTFTDFGDFATATGIATQSNGSFVVCGLTNQHSHLALMARYTKNGNLDSTFGENGKVTTAFNGSNDAAYALLIEPDDKILLAGSTNLAPGYTSNTTYCIIKRFYKNGLQDNSFGSNSEAITNFKNDSADAAHAIAFRTDGKIIAAGEAYQNFAVVSYRNDSSTNIAAANTSSSRSSEITFTNVKAYPDPVTNILHIQGLNGKPVSVSIVDVSGKILQQKTISGNTYDLYVKQLPAGIYYLLMQDITSTKPQINSIRFMKQ